MLTAMCIEAANRIINKTNEYNKTKTKYSEKIFLSCKRLQKILYFSEIEYMLRHQGQSMFKDEFHAWPSGPVIPSIYDEFVQYQNGEMHPVESGVHEGTTPEMDSALDFVFEKTKDMDTGDIIKKSHEPHGPWDKVYDEKDVNHRQVISKKDMYEYYKDKQLFV